MDYTNVNEAELFSFTSDERTLEKLEKALSFAREKHKGQYRTGGKEYITHPVAVCKIVIDKGLDVNYAITALFHDLLEDTDATDEEIEKIGGKDVLEAVKLLTKVKGYSMDEYVSAIKRKPLAKVVKGADRLHNLLCATECNDEFVLKYIYETEKWYMDFDKRIPEAVKRLAERFSFSYEEILARGKEIIEKKKKTAGN